MFGDLHWGVGEGGGRRHRGAGVSGGQSWVRVGGRHVSLRHARSNPGAPARRCTEDPHNHEHGIGHRADTETAQFRRLKCGPRSSLVQPKSRRPRKLPIVPIHYRYKFNVSIRIITKFVNKY